MPADEESLLDPKAASARSLRAAPDRSLAASRVLLAALFAFALLAHEWQGYQVGLAVFALAATVLCLMSERASITLFIGASALDAYGFITHEPFSLSIARVVVVVVVAGAVVRWLRATPRPKLALSVWDAGILVFLAGAALSVPFSASLSLSLVGILHVIFLAGAYVVLSRAARTRTGLNDISTTTIAVGSLSALVALGQAFVPRFPLEILRATSAVGDAVSEVRASAFFDNPNTMALLLVLGVLFAVERAWTRAEGPVRWVAAGAAVLGVVGIGVSYSRAALIGIVVGIVVLGVLLVRRARYRLLFAGAVVVLLAALLAIPGVADSAGTIVDFQDDPSAMDRVYLSEVSLKMFADHPITGVGIQAFRAAYPRYEDDRVSIDPVTDGHQMPLSVPAETGALGLFAELILAGALGWALLASVRAQATPYAAGGLAAMAAICVMALFNTFIFFESLWIAAALVGATFLTRADDLSDRSG